MSGSNRWRFAADFDGVPREERVIEVECEPTRGVNLSTGGAWDGLHVKARYPLRRDRRWKRANITSPVASSDERAAVEAVALRLLREGRP